VTVAYGHSGFDKKRFGERERRVKNGQNGITEIPCHNYIINFGRKTTNITVYATTHPTPETIAPAPIIPGDTLD